MQVHHSGAVNRGETDEMSKLTTLCIDGHALQDKHGHLKLERGCYIFQHVRARGS